MRECAREAEHCDEYSQDADDEFSNQARGASSCVARLYALFQITDEHGIQVK